MAFKMKNTGGSFKMMGSSPMKDTQYFGQNTSVEESSRVTKHNKAHKDGLPEDHKAPLKQTDGDLKEYLISEKGFNQKDADLQIADGSHSVKDAGFKKWFETSNKSDDQSKDVDGDLSEGRLGQEPAAEEESI